MSKEAQLLQGKKIAKSGKIVVFILLTFVALLIIACGIFIAFWSGAFNFLFPNELATFDSPDGEYSLVFEQMGEPEWPFGPTDVRLTLKNRDGKRIGRVSTQIHDDGANANKFHVKSISWNDDAVVVTLRGSEMQDKEISIAYTKK